MTGEHKFKFGGDGDYTDHLASAGQHIEFYHVISGKSVFFKAFVTQFEDDFQTSWNEEDAYGRMDTIPTFKNTKRKISLAWDLPAASAEEGIENMRKCSLLAAMHYPSYDNSVDNTDVSIIKSPPIFKLKFLNLAENFAAPGGDAATSGLLGYTSGFKYSPEFGDEGGFFGPSKEPRQIYPKLVRLSCVFTVLHQSELGWDKDGNQRNNFNTFPYSIDNSQESTRLPVISKSFDAEQENEIISDNATSDERQNSILNNSVLANKGTLA